MLALSDLPVGRLHPVAGVLTDIDDTLTSDGRIGAAAYTALERLHDAGYRVVPVTGRPAGWCDLIARTWPVDAVVGENGAFYFRYERRTRRMQRRRHDDATAAVAAAGPDALERLARRILEAVPGSALAADQPYREHDLAIDFCEDVSPLPRDAVARIVELAHAAGASARVSSIHVNIWFGTHDKLSMTRTLLAECFGEAESETAARYVFVGDSPNDEPMFRFFERSIGVANIRDFIDRIAHPPAFVTRARGGAGFVEIVDHLLDG